MVDFRRTVSGEPDGYEAGILRIHGHGDEPLENITSLLLAINDAYEGIVRYQFLLDRLYSHRRWLRRYEPIFGSDIPVFQQMDYLTPTLLPPGFRLSLKGVRLESPGFWDFFGKLNPLEVLRVAINDAHERRKDREYRESAEKNE